jgi:hypothetical protein
MTKTLLALTPWGLRMHKPTRPQMYVIVRGDFSSTYKMVQGTHALAAYALNHPEKLKTWNNEYLIFLETFLEQNLKSLYVKLLTKDIVVSAFREPDQNNQITAIAVYEDGTGRVKKALDGLSTAK